MILLNGKIQRLDGGFGANPNYISHSPKRGNKAVYSAVEAQVFSGKGAARHSVAGSSISVQPWCLLASAHGVGFLTGQAEKKYNEAQHFLFDDADLLGCSKRWRSEMIGALAYEMFAGIFANEVSDIAEFGSGRWSPYVLASTGMARLSAAGWAMFDELGRAYAWD
jgi:hypothetical protein